MKFNSFVKHIVSIIMSMTLLSCTKGYNTESYLGDYTFSTVGEIIANEIIYNEDIGSEVVSPHKASFIVSPISGNMKIFKMKDDSLNELHIKVDYNNNTSVVINALVDATNNIELMSYSRNIVLLDKTGERIVYNGPVTIDGTGGIVDGILTLTPLRLYFPDESMPS